MASWHEGRLLAFDLETTSKDPEQARIVTAAIVDCGGGQPTETWTALADPGVPIPDEAAAIHGVTTERARAEGRPAVEVVSDVLCQLSLSAAALFPIIVYNARYDLTVLDRERARHGIDHPPLTEWGRLRVVDPFVIDKWLDRYRKGSRRLEAVCAHYGAKLDGAHDAASDALAAARLAWVLADRGRVVRQAWNLDMEAERADAEREWAMARHDLDALHDAQGRWAREQAVGLAEHFRSEGKLDDAAGVRTEWPVVPATVAA